MKRKICAFLALSGLAALFLAALAVCNGASPAAGFTCEATYGGVKITGYSGLPKKASWSSPAKSAG